MTAALIMTSGALTAGGCGPAGYIHQVTIKADSSVAAAQAVGAETYAPYWYTLAVQYLHRARQEAALADFQAANRFGNKAHNAAIKARELAVKRAANPENQDWLPPPELRTPQAGPEAGAKAKAKAMPEAGAKARAKAEAMPEAGAKARAKAGPDAGSDATPDAPDARAGGNE